MSNEDRRGLAHAIYRIGSIELCSELLVGFSSTRCRSRPVGEGAMIKDDGMGDGDVGAKDLLGICEWPVLDAD